jgi:hypothetical protein
MATTTTAASINNIVTKNLKKRRQKNLGWWSGKGSLVGRRQDTSFEKIVERLVFVRERAA